MKAIKEQGQELYSESSEREFLPPKKDLHIIKHFKLDLTQQNLHLYFSNKTKTSFLEFTVLNLNVERQDDHQQVTDETLKKLARVISLTNKMHTLKIDCSQCFKITDKGLRYLYRGIKGLTSLKHLSLKFKGFYKRCLDLTHVGFYHLYQALKTLTSLQDLTLSFQGDDLTEIGDLEIQKLSQALQELPSLRKIHLEFISFRGTTNVGMHSLIKTINKMTSLQTLALNFFDCENIDDAEIHKLAQTLMNLSSLQKIDLNFRRCWKITQEGSKVLSQALGKLTSLQNLKLGFIGCFDHNDAEIANFAAGLKPISSSLKSLHYDLRGISHITDIGMQTLGEAISSLSLLESISLTFSSSRSVSNTGIHEFCQVFAQLARLRHINLHFSYDKSVSDEGFMHLSQSLTKLTLLQSLNLAFECCKEITDNALSYLSEALKNVRSSLTEINLSFEKCDKITDAGVAELSQALSKLTFLQILHLNFEHCCQIDEGVTALGQTLKNLAFLQSFSLRCQDSEDDNFSTFTESIKALRSLRNIDIVANSYDLTKEDVENLIQALKTLQYLQSVCLRFNMCSYEDAGEYVRNNFYPTSKTLPYLKNLDIDFNTGDY